ncbi:MAG: hypothetical protein ACI8Y4_000704 [Candidatus Poriferisodalaceae bacterium]
MGADVGFEQRVSVLLIDNDGNLGLAVVLTEYLTWEIPLEPDQEELIDLDIDRPHLASVDEGVILVLLETGNGRGVMVVVPEDRPDLAVTLADRSDPGDFETELPEGVIEVLQTGESLFGAYQLSTV